MINGARMPNKIKIEMQNTHQDLDCKIFIAIKIKVARTPIKIKIKISRRPH